MFGALHRGGAGRPPQMQQRRQSQHIVEGVLHESLRGSLSSEKEWIQWRSMQRHRLCSEPAPGRLLSTAHDEAVASGPQCTALSRKARPGEVAQTTLEPAALEEAETQQQEPIQHLKIGKRLGVPCCGNGSCTDLVDQAVGSRHLHIRHLGPDHFQCRLCDCHCVLVALRIYVRVNPRI